MNVLLLYGGKSCEHDISIITACLARGYFGGKVFGAYFDKNNRCFLVPNGTTPKCHETESFKTQVIFLFGQRQIGLLRGGRIVKRVKIDVAVNCCHGRCGEDGTAAALCELCGVPMVGSGLISSAVTMDKIQTKLVLREKGFPCVDGVFLSADAQNNVEQVEKLGYPVVVKPSTLGSSIGISLCHNQTELKKGLEVAFSYDKRVLCEKALVDFFELNCAAMGTASGIVTSNVERPYTTGDLLTFQDKYQRGEKFTAKGGAVPKELAEQAKALTAEIYSAFDCGGVVRVDYLVADGKIYANEINSIPGSLSLGLWDYSPRQFGQMLLDSAIWQYRQANKLTREFSSTVLDGAKGVKK